MILRFKSQHHLPKSNLYWWLDLAVLLAHIEIYLIRPCTGPPIAVHPQCSPPVAIVPPAHHEPQIASPGDGRQAARVRLKERRTLNVCNRTPFHRIAQSCPSLRNYQIKLPVRIYDHTCSPRQWYGRTMLVDDSPNDSHGCSVMRGQHIFLCVPQRILPLLSDPEALVFDIVLRPRLRFPAKTALNSSLVRLGHGYVWDHPV